MNSIKANVPTLGGKFEITVEGRKIVSVKPAEEETDVFLGPGLFDIQVNGYGGRTCALDSASKTDAVKYISRIFWENGVAWWIPTVCTDSQDGLMKAFSYLAQAMEEDGNIEDSVPGFHLEGPYISPEDGPRGAHSLEAVRPPDWDEFQRLQEASGGRIRYVTVAPEIEGAEDFIRKCTESGVVVGMGHSNMGREDLKRGVDAGARLSTHLGNGAHDMIQRHNNYIWYQLDCRQTYASFITDGHHLPAECASCLIRAKGKDRSIIVSDCSRLGGMVPGKYASGKVELLPSGRLVLVGTTNLAGSSRNLRECVETAPSLARLTHAEAWSMASTRPAELLGMTDRLGIETGKEATFTVYSLAEDGAGITVNETWVAGNKVFDARHSERVTLADPSIDQSEF